jgi:hypothetical protein
MHDGTFDKFKSSRRERVDIRVGAERRRRWSHEEKLRIVRVSRPSGATLDRSLPGRAASPQMANMGSSVRA